ncbi:MAG: hypothetical protein AAB426_00885, partial [Myxococcota bacterium]
MKEPTPWRVSAQAERPSEHVLDLVEKASAVADWSGSSYVRVYERIERTVTGSRWPLARWGGLLALATAGAAVVALVVHPAIELHAPETVWQTVSLGDVGTIEVTDRTVLRLAESGVEEGDEQRVYVLAGDARASITKRAPERPLALVTPHVRVLV